VLPGLGQNLNRRSSLAALFAVPSLILLLFAIVMLQIQSPARLVAWIVAPQVLAASQAGDLPAIRTMASALFSPPGTPATGWAPPEIGRARRRSFSRA